MLRRGFCTLLTNPLDGLPQPARQHMLLQILGVVPQHQILSCDGVSCIPEPETLNPTKILELHPNPVSMELNAKLRLTSMDEGETTA